MYTSIHQYINSSYFYRVFSLLVFLGLLNILSFAPRIAHAGETNPPPSAVAPGPCSQGFWKNRADGKQGVVKNNFTTSFNDVVTNAVALSNGFFANNAALLAALNPPKPMDSDKQFALQYAAFLLNLAAGTTTGETNNASCRVCQSDIFTPTAVCGNANTLGEVLTNIQNGSLAGENATECLDLINNNDEDLGLVLHDTCQVACPCGTPFLPQTPNRSISLANSRLCGSIDGSGVTIFFSNGGFTACLADNPSGSWSNGGVQPLTLDQANACVDAMRSLGGVCADPANLPYFQ